MEIELKVTLDEVNIILTALGKLPIEQGLGIFAKIREQGQTQFTANQTASETTIEELTKSRPTNKK